MGPALLVALLLWVPGSAIGSWTLPRAPRTLWLAAAPAISIGVLFFVGSVLDLLSLPVSFATVGLPILVVSAAALLWGAGRRWRPARPRPDRATLLLVAAIVGATVLWLVVVPGSDAVPPATDGANHGIFVRRIVEFATLDPATVIPDDLLTGDGQVSFYPFGIHVIAAFLVDATSCSTAIALHVTTMALAACALPLGAFALTRELLPTTSSVRTTAAGSSALIAVALPAYPWATLGWGGLPLISAVALVPVSLALSLTTARLGWRAGCALGAAASGLLFVHTSEIGTIMLICVPMLVIAARRWNHRTLLAGGAAAVVVLAVMTAPILTRVLAGAAERADGDSPATTTPDSAAVSAWLSVSVLRELTGIGGILAVVLALFVTAAAVVGGWTHRRVREVRGLVVGMALLLVLAWASLIGNSIAQRLSLPWYSDGYRITATATPVLAVLAGIGATVVLQRPNYRRLNLIMAVTTGTVSVCLAYLLGLSAYTGFSVVTAHDRAQFAWLRTHVHAGERILNDHLDGSMWMYDLEGINPVFAPRSELWLSPSWADRNYLQAHIADIATDDRVRTLAAEWRVRYVVVGERIPPGSARRIDPAKLASSPGLRVVWHQGDAMVFEIKGANT